MKLTILQPHAIQGAIEPDQDASDLNRKGWPHPEADLDAPQPQEAAAAQAAVQAAAVAADLPALARIEPRSIQRLDESVVNRIAAGEIIHRPANALKELIENSLDAGAKMIKITLKEGGIKMLQIQDNGSGVRPNDLPLLCERFATSKLRDFSDLSKMTTFGFRGEALASISYVTASMNVISKTRDEPCAYKAYYTSGVLVPPKPGQSSAPQRCAGTDGTVITAEDLFYNVPQRRRALKSSSEEYNRALDVAAKYAVHFGSRGVGFVCRKASSNAADLSTPSSPTTTTIDTIRLLHGTSVARELVKLKPFEDKRLGFQVEGYISGANWSSKRTTMLCFINHRLVDCPVLKKSLEAMYASLLPKGGHPWIYISLDIEPERVDVNVHPTKKEVHFLDEDEIVERICQVAQESLAGANSSRTFQFAQALLPGAGSPDAKGKGGRESIADGASGDNENNSNNRSHLPRSAQKGYPQHLVRVDAKTRTLDSMLTRMEPARIGGSSNWEGRGMVENEGESSKECCRHGHGPGDDDEEAHAMEVVGAHDVETHARRTKTHATGGRVSTNVRIPESGCTLTSVRELRTEILKARHGGLTEALRNHTFVGVADLERDLSLLQHETKLYLVNHAAIIEEYAYQLVIRQFGSLDKVLLEPPPSVEDLLRIGLELETEVEESGLGRDEVVARIAGILYENAEMLQEYFSLVIDPTSKTLRALPNLLAGSKPSSGAEPEDGAAPARARPVLTVNLERLPQLLVRLGPKVDWEEEKACFESFSRELALACLPLGGMMTETTDEEEEEEEVDRERTRSEIRHDWFDNLSSKRGDFFLAPKRFLEQRVVLQVANLPDLYRVFERC
ncbi:DNA mismatch repair protein MutL [Violaceomyces palustris]|uniref:DNA mismatch repair protein MutL n=1 Tax=Violaceomyces palustris TaxID=1673888 RepID=A0ACD0P3P6_9BASI|nr:DNA mismatch repair protein MutL [Violaceomyces palustris]